MLWMIVRTIFWITFLLLPGAFALWGGSIAWKSVVLHRKKDAKLP